MRRSTCPSWNAAGGGKLRIEQHHRRKVEFALAQRGERLGKPRRAVGHLEGRRSHLAQHAVIARLVRLVEREHGIADQKHEAHVVRHGWGGSVCVCACGTGNGAN